MEDLTFIDLFSGIGGFHQALTKLGAHCVFSSEIDKYAIETYRENYHMDSDINIRDVDADSLPDHNILCAGFPCQTFSKAGKQEGFEDETKGTLFFEIERILKVKKPKYIILENVRNLVTHNKKQTWLVIKNHLKGCGYRITEEPLILSPHQFGIPQLRERVVILGKYEPDNVNEPIEIEFSELKSKEDNDIFTILDKDNNEEKYKISDYEKYVLQAWDDFYQNINLKIIGFPIWIDFFQKNTSTDFPDWKNKFIEKNNKLYKDNKAYIDSWMKTYNIADWIPTHKKFEWQAGTTISSIWEGVIQMRPSGIRVKTPNCFPALVAMVQIPIIGALKRRLTVEEARRLQSFSDDFIPNRNTAQAYRQFGNAVNVEVIKKCAEKLLTKYK